MQESGEAYFLKKILPPHRKTIFDVGACRGAYSKEARRFHPHAKIYAFEPHPRSLHYLEQAALKLNFNAYHLGLGNVCETRYLYDTHREGTAQASLYEEVFQNRPTISHETTITTIDQFCKEQAIEHIDLLKIDAEGFEYEILLGAKHMIGSLSVDVIQFELNHLSFITKRTIFDFMELLPEYRFYRILYRGLIPLDKRHRSMPAPTEHQNIIAWSPCSQCIYTQKH